jgi:phosphotransferase system  glucose/maltose/N-acetylglucosamine-specific IIC component
MWQADVAKAARFHPLGPILFAGTLIAVALLASGLASGRSWQLRLTPDVRKTAIVLVVAAFVTSWTLKLVWLGN